MKIYAEIYREVEPKRPSKPRRRVLRLGFGFKVSGMGVGLPARKFQMAPREVVLNPNPTLPCRNKLKSAQDKLEARRPLVLSGFV